MTDEWRQGSLGKLKRGLPDLVRERLIGLGADEQEHREDQRWRFKLEEDGSSATVALYKTGTCELAGRGAAADSVEALVLKIIDEDEVQQKLQVPVVSPDPGEPKWCVIAAPIRGVFRDNAECMEALGSRKKCGQGPVRVSNEREGWAILDGGIRLDPGRHAFTDASIHEKRLVGIAAVIVEMERREGEPFCLPGVAFHESELIEKREVTGVSPGDLFNAFRRLKHIFGEMLALYVALQEAVRLPNAFASPKLTIVHNYLGVSAWTCAAAPQGSFEILPGFSDAAERAKTWGPPEDETVMKVVQACWELATENNIFLEFRHQPRGRSEAAGVNHFVRFNRRADKLAFNAAKL